MDSFMDRISQRLGTSDVIRANSEAEARELEQTREDLQQAQERLEETHESLNEAQKSLDDQKGTIEAYETLLSEVRRLSLKCAETNEMTSQLVSSSIEKLDEYKAVGDIKDYTEEIALVKSAVEENSQSEKQSIEDLLKEQGEFIHKENVRVYRNVQAAVVEELKLQTEALALQNKTLEKKVKGIKPLAIIGCVFGGLNFLAIAAAVVLWILSMGL